MIKMFKRNATRYTVGAVLYVLSLWLGYRSGGLGIGPFIALLLAPAIIGGFWYWMQRITKKSVVCHCGAEAHLSYRQETGQRTIFHYQCSQCPKAWEVQEPDWEERRATSHS